MRVKEREIESGIDTTKDIWATPRLILFCRMIY